MSATPEDHLTFTSPQAEANFRSAVTAVQNASGASEAQARHVVTSISAYVARCLAD